MLKNRKIELDRRNTKELILNPNRPKYTGGNNWLDHGSKGGQDAIIDELLLEGTTMIEMEKLRKKSGVHQHLNHLKKEHGLQWIKIKGEDGEYIYQFDRGDLGIKRIEEESKHKNKRELKEDSESQKYSVGGGFGESEQNKIIEKAAIEIAIKDYERNGWFVKSVETEKCGYDLLCTKEGKEEHVEIKGVKGTRQDFIITSNELSTAKKDSDFVLFLVTSALEKNQQEHKYLQHDFLKKFCFKAISYTAKLKEQEEKEKIHP